MRTDHFDLIVIGTGPSASTVAKKCRASKGNGGEKSVAVVEAREFGGTCALRGCNPKKVYTNAANLLDAARGAKGKLVDYDRLQIDWQQLLAFKREFTQPVLEGSRESFDEQGIKTFRGAASFCGPTQMQVGEQRLSAERIFVGVGARPRPLQVVGAEHAIVSDDFLELSSIPKRVVFIGGGYISMEFACVVARYGSSVTILQSEQQVLPQFDADLVAQLVAYSADHGIDIRTNAKVASIDRGQDRLTVGYESANQNSTVTADLVIHGAGRIPNLDGLNLDAGEVAYSAHGIQVDEHMRSVSNRQVFAAGDCADSGQPRLTPTANEEARVVVENIFSDQPNRRPDYGLIPQVAFTVPPIASVGMSESTATESHQVVVNHEETSRWGSVRKSGQTCAGYKIIIDKPTNKILGAHLLGPGADETINLFALAMKHGLTATDIKSTLFAFPTFSSDVRRMV